MPPNVRTAKRSSAAVLSTFRSLLNGSAQRRAYSRPTSAAQTPQTSIQRPVVNTSWSSPQDRVMRNVFSSDYVHAWTLLEACLDHGNLDRAESVLMGLTEISGTGDITLAVNTYLQRLITANPGRPHVAIDWLRRMKYQVPRFQSNDATDALMLRNAALALESNPQLLPTHLAQIDAGRLKAILKQVEILGVDTIEKTLAVGPARLEDLHDVTKDAVAHARAHTQAAGAANAGHSGDGTLDVIAKAAGLGDSTNATNETTATSNTSDAASHPVDKLREPIQKDGHATLEPTQSMGLVAIRHVLSGLQLKSSSEQAAIEEISEIAGLPHVKGANSASSVDFFELYRNLKTDEERQRFDKALQQINTRRQKQVESKGIEAARMRWRQMFEQMVDADSPGQSKIQLKGLETLLWEWNQAMMPIVDFEMKRMRLLTQYASKAEIPRSLIKEHFPNMRPKELASRFEYAPYLCLAKPENLPAMTMMELLRLSRNTSDSSRSAVAMISVGKNLEREYKLESRKRARKARMLAAKSGASASIASTSTSDSASTNTNSASTNSVSSTSSASTDVDAELDDLSVSTLHSWPLSVRAKIGSFLISIFMQVAKVPVSGTDPVSGERVQGKAPAFHHGYSYQNGTKIGVLRPHNVVANYLSGESVALQPQQLPMLSKPRPWTSWNSGGYWYSASTVVRSKECPEQLAYIAAATERGQMQKVFDGLNVLGETAWTVNNQIFKVLTQIWNSKQKFLDIPPHVPPQPDLSNIPVPARNADPSELRDYRRRCRQRVLENGRLYSQRCDMNYKLDIARAFLGERFYLPHNVDFRGRAYPLSPHFNHLGNDMSRSLLIFWEGKPLGARGLYWLKIHLANLFGVNKASHAERVAFVDEHMPEILRSAANPLQPEGGWWQAADSPFQALAACMEITAAVEHPDGPENYVSHLTVHQDGSCNGLQHYAALGGDFEGAYQVNLQAADRPQDVYSRVCEIVKDKVANESAPELQETARLVGPILSRKVVKQTVMTHVYGVTFAGARDQVANRLRDLPSFPEDKVFGSSAYVAQKVLDAVRELFTSAHEIQDWLGDNASRISRAVTLDPSLHGADSKFVSSVIWTTPLGMPIVQPYRVPKPKQVNTELQTVYISDPYSFRSVNPRKQKTAFPPNYIHSLDATHMLMSAIKCRSDGVTFASVHDSYWTHAANVDTMNENLRESFVELHSENLIDKLREEFQTRYGQHLEVVEIPAKSAPAVAIKQLRDAFGREKYGRACKLTLPDLIEMELAAKDKPSPLKVMQALGPTELQALVKDASGARKSKAYLASHHQRSTEFEGTGTDNLQDAIAEEAAEEAEETLDDDEVAAKPSKSQRYTKTFVPLTVPKIPARGDFDVRNVLDSPYFFS